MKKVIKISVSIVAASAIFSSTLPGLARAQAAWDRAATEHRVMTILNGTAR